MLLTLAQLIAAGVAPTQARTFLDPLNAACDRFEINTPARIAAFLGQCLVESSDFTRTEESLYYRDPRWIAEVFRSTFRTAADASAYAKAPQALANKVYAGVNGNGDEASGDGFKYRGRGLIQPTGRWNYKDAALALARPYVEQPDLVAQPGGACLTAAWYWHSHKLNALADAGAVDAITKAVNGPRMLQADLRRQHTQEALVALA